MRLTKPIQRLCISSVEDTAIREGFEALCTGADCDTALRGKFIGGTRNRGNPRYQAPSVHNK